MQKQFINVKCLEKALSSSAIFENAVLIGKCPSTNDVAKNIIKNSQNFKSGIILTNSQTKGRGRREKTWISEDGLSLTFSLVIDASDIKLAGLSSLLSAKALHQAILEYEEVYSSDKKLTIKYPNDIYAGDKKIAGILTENIYDKNTLKKQVIGIGLNFGTTTFDSEELKNAGSIKSEYGFLPKSDELLLKIVKYLENVFEEDLFDYEYINRFSFLNGKKVLCTVENNKEEVEVITVNNKGELLVKLENGSVKSLLSGIIDVLK